MLKIKDSKILVPSIHLTYHFSYSYFLDNLFLDIRKFLNNSEIESFTFSVDFKEAKLNITLSKFKPIKVLDTDCKTERLYFLTGDTYVLFKDFTLRGRNLKFLRSGAIPEILKSSYVGITINDKAFPESVISYNSGDIETISKRLVRNIEKRIYKFWLSNSKKLALIELEREEAHKRSLIEGTAKYDVMVNYKNSKIDQLLQMVNTIENTKIRKRLSRILNSEKGFY